MVAVDQWALRRLALGGTYPPPRDLERVVPGAL